MKINRLSLAGLALAACTFVSAARADVAPPQPPGTCGLRTKVGTPCGVGATWTDAGQPGTCQYDSPPTMRCFSPDKSISMGPACRDMGEGEPCQVTYQLAYDDAGVKVFNGTCGLYQSETVSCVANAVAPSAEPEAGGCSLGFAGSRRTRGPWLLVGSFAVLVALLRRRRS